MIYDPKRLEASLTRVEWSKPSTIEETGVHHGYRRNHADIRDAFAWLLSDFEPVKEAWISHIDPGGYIRLHRDAGPHYERWQIPIQPAGTFTVDGVLIDQQPGVPFQVEHWKWHEVCNDSNCSRIHLVVDRDVVVRPEPTEFLVKGT